MRPRARNSDPITSHLAAWEKQLSGEIGNHMMIVAQCVLRNPGCTSRELTDKCKLERHEVSRRLADCEKVGWVGRGLPRSCTVAGRKMLSWWPTRQFSRMIDTTHPPPRVLAASGY